MVDQAKYLSGFYTIQIFLFVDKLCTLLCDPPRLIRRRNILDLIPPWNNNYHHGNNSLQGCPTTTLERT